MGTLSVVMPRSGAASTEAVIGRFVFRRSVRGAVIWAAAFGVYVAAKAAGYASAYPTGQARAAVAALYGHNTGTTALLGVPHSIDTVTGFTAWNTLNIMAMIGAVWALMVSTKTFRGEEESGRWEPLLAGPITARQAAASALAGLGGSLAVFYLVIAALFIGIGRIHDVDFGVGDALFFALAAIAGPAMFMAIGAAAGQLMPTRGRAAGFSAAIFGVSALLHAAADSANAQWLLALTPLGWIEQLRPLTETGAVWLVPIGAWVAACCGLTIWLAGRRDLGASRFAGNDTAPPHTLLLGNFNALAIRLTRAASGAWILAVAVMAGLLGALAKSDAQAMNTSQIVTKALSRLESSTANGTDASLGITFLMIMIVTMAYVAGVAASIRNEEASGYLDNLLVRSVGRAQWLTGRVLLGAVITIFAGSMGGALAWIGLASQGENMGFHALLLAGVNAASPAILILGVGVFAIGLAPRLTSALTYGVIAWSFLVVLAGTGIDLNHWILDTSVLHQVALAPAAGIMWDHDAVIACIGVVLCAIGVVAFNSRDLQAE